MDVRLALYVLLTGIALVWSILFWHVWSDNAFLGPYIVGELLLIGGTVVALVAGARAVGTVPALAAVAVAGAVAYVLVGPLGITRPLASAFVAGGNGSQSPCVAEFRRSLPEEVRRGPSPPPGVPQTSPAEARESDVRGLMGLMTQSLTPFVAGAAGVALAVRRSSRRWIVRAAAPAAVAVGYVYVRGAGAWCGELFGLDAVVVLAAGAILAVLPPGVRSASA